MGEETVNSPESREPIEVRFGDIVQCIRDDGYRAATGVIVEATADTLTLDDLSEDEKGQQRILPTGGTYYGKVEVIGHLDDTLPMLIEALEKAGERFKIPPEETQEFIEEARTEAAKGPVMFTPAKPRTEEEWAEINRQLEKDHPNFFKSVEPK